MKRKEVLTEVKLLKDNFLLAILSIFIVIRLVLHYCIIEWL